MLLSTINLKFRGYAEKSSHGILLVVDYTRASPRVITSSGTWDSESRLGF
jgi:hypothetical protein